VMIEKGYKRCTEKVITSSLARFPIILKEMVKLRKSNKNISIVKDNEKSYVYVKDGKKDIGILMWHYKKKKWVFE